MAHVPVANGVLLFDTLWDVVALAQVGGARYWLVFKVFNSVIDGNKSGRVECGTRKHSGWW